MGKFYLHQGTKLIATGMCPDGDEHLQGEPGLSVGLGEPPPDIVADTHVPAPQYDALRAREYPRIGDQLDALWKAIGPTAPGNSEARAMYDKILAVKAKHPKP